MPWDREGRWVRGCGGKIDWVLIRRKKVGII